MRSRIFRAAVLGAMVSVLFAQRAEAWCIVQPLPRLVKTSDEVWWGTITEASVAPPRSPGQWKLTVTLDDVLKGDGMEGDVVNVYTSSCGGFITPATAKSAADSFVGQQRFLLVRVDRRGRQVAYSEIVKVRGDKSSSPHQQYVAAVQLLHGGAGLAAPGQATDGGARYNSATWFPLLLAALILLIPLTVVTVILRRRYY